MSAEKRYVQLGTNTCIFIIFFLIAMVTVHAKKVNNNNNNNIDLHKILKQTINQRNLVASSTKPTTLIGNKSIPFTPSPAPPSNGGCQNGRAQGHSGESQHSSTIYTFIAVGCVTFASTISNLGMNLQKLALRRGLATGDKDLSKENSNQNNDV